MRNPTDLILARELSVTEIVLLRKNCNYLWIYWCLQDLSPRPTAVELRAWLLEQGYQWAERDVSTIWRWLKDIQTIVERHFPSHSNVCRSKP
jgi:hypothetical protein